ncbi:MAG: SPOR domain-containing protein [Gemmatimonadales bacterium]|jgi:hypothetical protein
MIGTDDPAAPLARSIPELLSGAALVALVPATADLDSAAAMAWNLARATASSGRRVALVDCHVDEPQLHATAGEDNRDGIVDVFEYGASLSRIARQQSEPNLYFVPAGTFAPDPAVMASHPRWRRLSAGFRHEDAVMLLFLPADCIGSLASVLDGMVALAPDGAEAGLASTPEIEAAADAGIPLLATLTDSDDLTPVAEPAPAEASAPELAEPVLEIAVPESAPELAEPVLEIAVPESAPEPSAPFLRRLRAPRSAWGVRAAVYGCVTLLAAAVLVLTYRRQLGLGDLGLKAPGAGDEPDSAPRMSIVPAFRKLTPHAVDTLPFAVQTSAWTSLAFALDAGDALEARGFAPMIAPIRIGGRLWYRVYAGPVAGQDAADSLLAAVRDAGLDRPRTAVPVLVPLSLALRRVATADAARAERARLRGIGIPAFVLGQADGTYRLYAGAYGAPEQAGNLDSLVTSTGSAGQLGPRVGFHP